MYLYTRRPLLALARIGGVGVRNPPNPDPTGVAPPNSVDGT
jgi:hypothetical protein